MLLANGHAYRAFETPEELEAERKAQIAAKLPPRTAARSRNLSQERDRREPRCGQAVHGPAQGADGGLDDLPRRAARRHHLRPLQRRRPGAAEVRRLPHLPPRQRRRRPPDADHRRDSRRGVDLVDAEACAALPGVRLGAAALLAHAAAAQRGQEQDLEAQESGLADLLPRGWLPAAGDAELPRPDGRRHAARRRSRRSSPRAWIRKQADLFTLSDMLERFDFNAHLARRAGLRPRQAEVAERRVPAQAFAG